MDPNKNPAVKQLKADLQELDEETKRIATMRTEHKQRLKESDQTDDAKQAEILLLREDIQDIDAELERLRALRQEKGKALSALLPPPVSRVSVNSPKQLAMNERIKADTRRRLAEAGKLEAAGLK